MRTNVAGRRVRKDQSGGDHPPTITTSPFGEKLMPGAKRFQRTPAGIVPHGKRPLGLRRATPIRGGRRYVGGVRGSAMGARRMNPARSLRRRGGY